MYNITTTTMPNISVTYKKNTGTSDAPVLSNISYINAYLVDYRSYFEFHFNVDQAQAANLVSAQVSISKKSDDVTGKPILFSLSAGKNLFGKGSTAVGVDGDSFDFVDDTVYVIKSSAAFTESGTVVPAFQAYYSTSETYEFRYRVDGGDKFDGPQCLIRNEASIEAKAGNVIKLSCPLTIANVNDSRRPTDLLFTFDEVDNYPGSTNDSDNVEGLSKYAPSAISYRADGLYELTQTASLKLINDSAYKIMVIAIYSDGYTTTVTFDNILHVISLPVIDSVVAYGFDADQSGADDSSISSVMNVYMNALETPIKLTPTNNNIKFYLKQGANVMYQATMTRSTTAVNGKIQYTINKGDLNKVWTTTAPTQKSNKSYEYEVVAEINFLTVYENTFIDKISTGITKTFTSDIISLSSFTALNAWVAAANVAGTGHRTVDMSNTITANGYAIAPELGVVGKFNKTDFYGSGITDGFFKDLDTVNTNHKFTVIVNGVTKVVPTLYQIQGYGTKTDQELYIELLSSVANANKYTNENGLFPNIPGTALTLGSLQKPIYFWIPSDTLFEQSDSVKVSIAIQPPAGETTRPSATESAAQVIVAKINQYTMVSGQASEVKFSGSGATATLIVPINNPNTKANEFYFNSAIFTSNMSAPNDTKEVPVSNAGVFDISVVDPSKRGEGAGNACTMQVRYKINDPNNVGGTITGPISSDYTFNLMDNPDLTNFTVSNYSYETFNANNISKVKFDLAFQTVANKGIDGVYVYFRSDNNDAIPANDIPLTRLMDIKRSAGDAQLNQLYTLQDVAAVNASLTEGVKIKDSTGTPSVNKWLNYKSGEIVFKPYFNILFLSNASPSEVNLETVKTVFNIPSIPMPTNMVLTGGVKESHTATKTSWDDALAVYANSSLTASYKLLLNNSEVAVTNHGYTIDLSAHAASSVVTLKLQVKLTTSDSLIYLSDTAELNFTVASIDVSGMTNTVKRGSNNTVLRVTRGDYAITPVSGANVTEVKLIDNVTIANTNPELAQVKVLTCTSTANAVQPVGPTTVNEYNLTADGYALGDDVDMQYRLKAGVQYTTKYGSAAASPFSSTDLFLTIASPQSKYIVATKPEIEVTGTSYRVQGGGLYDGRVAVNLNINAKGLHAEGLQSVVFILAQEGNYTNSAMQEESRQVAIAFQATSGLTKSYTVGANANIASATDNLAANEVQEVAVTDLPGFSEGSLTRHTLAMGNLLSNDQSTLYLAADAGFSASSPLTVVAVGSTRLGGDIAFKDLVPS